MVTLGLLIGVTVSSVILFKLRLPETSRRWLACLAGSGAIGFLAGLLLHLLLGSLGEPSYAQNPHVIASAVACGLGAFIAALAELAMVVVDPDEDEDENEEEDEEEEDGEDEEADGEEGDEEDPVAELESAIEKLEGEVAALEAEIECYREENAGSEEEIARIRDAMAERSGQIEERRLKIDERRRQVEEKRRQIAELEPAEVTSDSASDDGLSVRPQQAGQPDTVAAAAETPPQADDTSDSSSDDGLSVRPEAPASDKPRDQR